MQDRTVQNEFTPLHVATHKGCTALVRMLLEAGAEKNLKTTVTGVLQGWTILGQILFSVYCCV